MKVLIWIVFIIIFSMVQTAINMSGVKLGAIPTIIYWALFYWVVRTCCRAWDKYKNGSHQSEETTTTPDAANVSTAHPVVKSEEAPEFISCPKCGKSQKATRNNCFYCGTDLTAKTKIEIEKPVFESEHDDITDMPVHEAQGTSNAPDAILGGASILIEPTVAVPPEELAIPQTYSVEPETIQEKIQGCDDDFIVAAYCGKCGNKIIPGNQFCVYCGAPIVPVAEQNEKETRTPTVVPASSIEHNTTSVNSEGEKEKQKRKPNRKKIIIISGISVAAVIAVLIGIYFYTYNRSLNFAKEGKFDQAESWLLAPSITKLHNAELLTYIEAGQMLDAGDYDQAMKLLKDVDGNSSIQEMAQEAQYQKAAKLLADGDTESAINIYSQLQEENYKDSQEIYISILADEFKTALADGDYETALNLYDNYPADYFDSDPNLESYMEALWFYIGGSYVAAANAFDKLGDYSDASTMAKKSKYQEGLVLLNDGNYPQAKECFAVLGDYSDSEDQVKECNYQYAIELHQDSNSLVKAYETMVTVAGYSDADTLIEQYASEIYDKAREYYQTAVADIKKNGAAYSDFTAAKKYFEAIADYQYSNNYLTLIEGISGSASDDTYKKLVNLIRFDDAKYGILHKYVFNYLCGSWYSSGGSYYFTLKNTSGSSYQSTYNLPGNYSGTFELKDGIYTINGNNVYKFSIVSYDSVDCYCYSNGSTYRLYRQ